MGTSHLTGGLQETLALFTPSGPPLTTMEVATRLDLGRRSAYDRLDRLVDHGALETKKVGAKGRVWWQSGEPDEEQPASPAPADLVLDGVLDSADVGVCVLDETFEIVWTNATLGAYLGIDHEQLRGRDKPTVLEETIAPIVEDTEGFRETLLETYEDNQSPAVTECRIPAADERERRWLEHRSQPIETGPLAGGRVELYYDITELKTVTQDGAPQREQFESLVEGVDDHAIFMLDPDGHVQTWNPGAAQLKGYERDEILGEHVSTFYPEDARAAGRPASNLAAAREQGSIEREGWRVRADGSRFWAHVTISAVSHEGRHTGYAKITRDMTERREREQQLQRERNLTDRLLETVPLRLAIFDPDGTLDRINTQARRELGMELSDPTGFHLEELELSDTDGKPVAPAEHPVTTVIETG